MVYCDSLYILFHASRIMAPQRTVLKSREEVYVIKSGLSGWALAIAHTLDSEGIPYQPVFRKVGMDPAFLTEGRNRYSQESISRLWRVAIQETGDPYFGLRLAKHIRPSTFHVVGYAMSCSVTLGAALQRFARYAKLISSSATIALTHEPDRWQLSFNFDTGTQLFPQNLDAALAGIVCFSRWLAGEDLAPIETRFMHPLPEGADPQEYEKVLGCPVYFGQVEDSVTFHVADMDRTIDSADEQLACILDDMTIRQLADLAGRFSTQVRKCLFDQFSRGQISKHCTADLMHMTERTLLRRLRDEGTTFREVLDKLREELAYEYMRRPGATLEEVSSMLGFSDASTFSRAFKRWTGNRPSYIHTAFSEQTTTDASSVGASR